MKFVSFKLFTFTKFIPAIFNQLINTIIISIVFISIATPAVSAPENLDQIIARKARMSTALWSYAVLENENNNFIWQPETLSYNDITTGNEVWKMSSTPSRYNAFHSDIGVSPWSANGNRMAFKSDRDTGAFSRSGSKIWLLVNTDGSRLRPIPGAPARVDKHTPYFHWSPKFPDTFYELGKTAAGNSGVSANVLYKATVSDTTVNRTALITLPTTKGTDLKLNKTVSADGNKAIVMTWDESWLFPVTITDGSAHLDVASGYTIDRDMGGIWGDTPTSFSAHHDAYYPGDGSYLFFMPSGTHAWWKDKVLGSAADGGSVYSYSAPSTFGEQIPANTVNSWGGTNDPFGSDYWSHFVPDRWGHYALFSSVEASPMGPGVWDMYTNNYVVYTFGGGTQHHDWNGFSDWAISTMGPTGNNYTTDRIYTEKFDSSGSQQTVVYTHTLYNNGGTYVGASFEYDSIPRPGQSPDGTKVAFHSTYLNNKGTSYDNLPDVYWAVAYYPYPPEIKSIEKNGSLITLHWDFNQGTVGNPNHINPRTYSRRGWPDESEDRPPSPREIKLFRVWSSPDNHTWVPIGTTAYRNTGGNWTEGTWEFSITQSNDTTKYYAITSLEYSGIESHTLSNVWKVTLDAQGNIAQQMQENEYPTEPGGKTQFYENSPPSVAYIYTQTSVSGQYVIRWTVPLNASMIRYYNIYANDGSAPFTSDLPIAQRQKYRIASIAATSKSLSSGSFEYIDWLGARDRSTQYIVTAVDFQGNESVSIVLPPQNLKSTKVTSP